jgi:RNA polymerase sigma-70 factor, ECF subfamily
MGHPKLKTSDIEAIESLVKKAKSGDEPAMSELIRRTSQSVFRFVLYLGGSRELANDLVQETYLYALENLSSLKKEGAFPKWLFLIAKNKFLDYKRSPRNQSHASLEAVAEIPGITGEQRELHMQATEVLAKMSEEDRLVLLLVDLEGHSYAEAAEVVGVSESAMVSRLYRARQRFQQLFSKG